MRFLPAAVSSDGSDIRHMASGDVVPLTVSPDHLHLFDPAAGARSGG